MKFSILITYFLLKLLPSLMCVSMSKVTKTHGKGVNCETHGATEPDINDKMIASLVDRNRKIETPTSRDELHSNMQGYFNKNPMNKISVKRSIGGESETIKRRVIQGAAHRGGSASGYEDSSNGDANKTSAELVSLLDSVLNLHSGVKATDAEEAVALLPTEVKVIPKNTNSTDLSTVLDDLFKVVTFKISHEAFSKLFFPDDPNAESNASNKLSGSATNFFPPKAVEKDRTIETEIRSRKVLDERLAGSKENIAPSRFDPNFKIKHHKGKKNIETVLKDMDEIIAKQFQRVNSHRLPATTISPLHVDEILQQMQILIDSSLETPSEHPGNTIKKFESTGKQEHKDMPEIIDEMDKLLHIEGVKSPSKTSSASDFQSILDQMEAAVIREQKASAVNEGTQRTLRSRRRRSLWKKDPKNHLFRSRLLVPLTKYRTSLSTKEPNEEPCTLPYVDVAYKVCILPVLDRQLSWHDARQYCRSRGLELVIDSAAIKGRKYFNNQLGEIGSRERWTLWVGGRKNEGKWEWNDGIPVPSFLWSKNEPRTYDRDSTPAGTCMAIHGFSEYYGTALPCHHRRRFVCQKI